MSIRDQLIAAKTLIDSPEKWVQGSFDITRVSGLHCYCAIGAVEQVTDRNYLHDPVAHALAASLPDGLPEGWGKEPASVISFNDLGRTTHADVMALYDRAIEAAAP